MTEHQYQEGDVDSTVYGTAVLWEDAADTLRVASTTKPLPVTAAAQPGTDIGDVTVNNAAGSGVYVRPGWEPPNVPALWLPT